MKWICPDCGSDDVEYYRTCICRDCGMGFVPDGWISVKDRLPENDGWYLTYVYCANTPEVEDIWIFKFENGEFVFTSYLNVTHWMPLPEPPESEG